ncbi:hypothetical protein BCR42DRAFT_433762 [Absidia repens]|uniref:Yeast cell wall synthesis Kre9/Knh1-like N-terminal domain-containing protein n=1 Tax=Absidia repens TaxID=90262 RepID=A0A1X2IW42_9FUNG|nr:hypothetical protein BCR42DRAFT_433762 [Absidia repens]
MKSTFITLAAVASFVGYSNGAVVFKDPWAGSKTWRAGEKADIKWTSGSTDADKLCDIQMLNGDTSNSNIVATVTNPNQPVKCGVNEFEIVPLNDFKTGKYWLRIGQAKANTWTYSGAFTFEGKGTALPLKLADGSSSEYPTAEAPKGNNEKTKKERKKEEKNEKKKEEKKERKESAPRLASQGSSSVGGAKATGSTMSSKSGAATNGVDSSKSSFLSAPTNKSSGSKGSAPPTVMKDSKNNEHDKKTNSAATSDILRNNLVSHAIVIGLASFAAYALA